MDPPTLQQNDVAWTLPKVPPGLEVPMCDDVIQVDYSSLSHLLRQILASLQTHHEEIDKMQRLTTQHHTQWSVDNRRAKAELTEMIQSEARMRERASHNLRLDINDLQRASQESGLANIERRQRELDESSQSLEQRLLGQAERQKGEVDSRFSRLEGVIQGQSAELQRARTELDDIFGKSKAQDGKSSSLESRLSAVEEGLGGCQTDIESFLNLFKVSRLDVKVANEGGKQKDVLWDLSPPFKGLITRMDALQTRATEGENFTREGLSIKVDSLDFTRERERVEGRLSEVAEIAEKALKSGEDTILPYVKRSIDNIVKNGISATTFHNALATTVTKGELKAAVRAEGDTLRGELREALRQKDIKESEIEALRALLSQKADRANLRLKADDRDLVELRSNLLGMQEGTRENRAALETLRAWTKATEGDFDGLKEACARFQKECEERMRKFTKQLSEQEATTTEQHALLATTVARQEGPTVVPAPAIEREEPTDNGTTSSERDYAQAISTLTAVVARLEQELGSFRQSAVTADEVGEMLNSYGLHGGGPSTTHGPHPPTGPKPHTEAPAGERLPAQYKYEPVGEGDGGPATMLRFRCLSCNRLAGPLVETPDRKPGKQHEFPPGSTFRSIDPPQPPPTTSTATACLQAIRRKSKTTHVNTPISQTVPVHQHANTRIPSGVPATSPKVNSATRKKLNGYYNWLASRGHTGGDGFTPDHLTMRDMAEIEAAIEDPVSRSPTPPPPPLGKDGRFYPGVGHQPGYLERMLGGGRSPPPEDDAIVMEFELALDEEPETREAERQPSQNQTKGAVGGRKPQPHPADARPAAPAPGGVSTL